MIDVREVEPGVWSVIDGTRSVEIRLVGDEVRVNGVPVAVDTSDPRQWSPQAARGAVAGSAQVKSPMPGKVIEVLVMAGQEVAAGQGVVVVEAMKMQNQLKSPREGRVQAIHARQGELVNAGAVLVTIE
jgi:biotin carboxyl carrier protein